MVNVKNLILGIGIVIVFALVLWQGIEAFSPSPQWNDFCGDVEPIPRPLEGEAIPESKDNFKECRQNYDEARDAHSKIVFFVALIVGIITVIIGYTILSTEPVGSALIGSGIWAIFWGSLINWRNFASVWRFVLLLLALVLLIWLTLKLNSKKEKGFWFSLGFGKR